MTFEEITSGLKILLLDNNYSPAAIKFVTIPPAAAQMIMKASIPPFHIG